MEGKFKSESPFDDSDVSKVIEGAAYALSADEDPELEAYVDSVISYMKAAQEEDGYLYTYRTIREMILTLGLEVSDGRKHIF